MIGERLVKRILIRPSKRMLKLVYLEYAYKFSRIKTICYICLKLKGKRSLNKFFLFSFYCRALIPIFVLIKITVKCFNTKAIAKRSRYTNAIKWKNVTTREAQSNSAECMSTLPLAWLIIKDVCTTRD